MMLIALSITVAYAYSSVIVFIGNGKLFYWELATLIDVMLLGHWIEMKSVMGASRTIEDLAKLLPSEAHRRLANGKTEDVKIDELKKGDRVLVKPGEKIPVDGIVIEGVSSVNEALISGESLPVTKLQDDKVIGGAVENNSEHPVAKGIVDEAEGIWNVINFNSIPGKGAEGKVNGNDVKVVSPGYLHNMNANFNNNHINELLNKGRTVIFVLINNQAAGAIALADIIRREAREAITQ